MGLPPWSSSPSQWFVLVTGANGDLGSAICERTINEFLTSPIRDPKSHLVLILSTRSESNTRRTTIILQQFLRFTTTNNRSHRTAARALEKRAAAQGKVYDWRTEAARVHFLGFEVDLCVLPQIYDAARRVKGQNGGLGSPNLTSKDGSRTWVGLKGIIIPRLDVIFMNAGIGGWLGIKYFKATWSILTNMPDAVTAWDNWIFPKPAALAPQRITSSTKDSSETAGDGTTDPKSEDPKLGKVFCANVFGHYILGHELMPLLSTGAGREPGHRGRIIWMTSVEGTSDFLSFEDIQGLDSENPYCSSKRVTDLLTLSAHLPSLRHTTASYFAIDEPLKPSSQNGHAAEPTTAEAPTRPEMYVVHPGVCSTAIANVNVVEYIFQMITFFLARWMGSPWHPIQPYRGAVAPAWTIVTPQSELDAAEEYDPNAVGGPAAMAKAKWGSSTNRWGRERVVKTEVGGWGWSGRVGDKGIEGGERYRVGRLRGAADLTKEGREEFEVEAREVWVQMEKLRKEWEGRLGISKV